MSALCLTFTTRRSIIISYCSFEFDYTINKLLILLNDVQTGVHNIIRRETFNMPLPRIHWMWFDFNLRDFNNRSNFSIEIHFVLDFNVLIRPLVTLSVWKHIREILEMRVNIFQSWCEISDKSTDFIFQLTHPRPILKMLKHLPLTLVLFSFSIKYKPCRKPQEMRWREFRFLSPLIILLLSGTHFFKVFFYFLLWLNRAEILVIRLSRLVNDISNLCYDFLRDFIFILHSLLEISCQLVQSWMIVY